MMGVELCLSFTLYSPANEMNGTAAGIGISVNG